jgi:hypothetical protein
MSSQFDPATPCESGTVPAITGFWTIPMPGGGPGYPAISHQRLRLRFAQAPKERQRVLSLRSSRRRPRDAVRSRRPTPCMGIVQKWVIGGTVPDSHGVAGSNGQPRQNGKHRRWNAHRREIYSQPLRRRVFAYFCRSDKSRSPATPAKQPRLPRATTDRMATSQSRASPEFLDEPKKKGAWPYLAPGNKGLET